MENLKILIRRIKIAWRYLVIVLFFGLLPSITFADEIIDFDDNTLQGGTCYGEAGDCVVSSEQYSSSPYSLRLFGHGYSPGGYIYNHTQTYASIKYVNVFLRSDFFGGTGDYTIISADCAVTVNSSGVLKDGAGNQIFTGFTVDDWWTLGWYRYGNSCFYKIGGNSWLEKTYGYSTPNSGSVGFLSPSQTGYYHGVNYFDDLEYQDIENVPTPPVNGLQIDNPTEDYAYANVQPMPFMFKYVNPDGDYDRVWIQIDQMHTPQYSLSPLSYNIETTVASTVGMVYSSLAQGSYRVQGFLYNSITDTISSSTGYVNFTVSTSTVPVGTIPSYTDQDFNELTKTPIWSTSSVDTFLNANLDCNSGNWWDKITCNVSKAVIAIPQGVVTGLKMIWQGFIVSMGSLFPFNLPIQFYNAWVSSATATLPTELSFISNYIDGNGNLTIQIPTDFDNQSTTTAVVIFGESLFRTPDGGIMDLFFGFLRLMSKYLMWGGFIYAIWKLGEDVYTDLINVKKEDTV